MVGNGATDWDFDVSPSFPETLYNFNIITSQTLNEYNANNCTYYFNDFRDPTGPKEPCETLWQSMNETSKDLNWYDLYRTDAPPIPTFKPDGSIKGMTQAQYTPWLKPHMS